MTPDTGRNGGASPRAVEIEVGGERLRVEPVSPVDLPRLLHLNDQLRRECQESALVARFGLSDNLVEMLALGTGRPGEWLENLPLDEFYRVAGAVFAASIPESLELLGEAPPASPSHH